MRVVIMMFATSETGYAHLLLTPDITTDFTVVYECFHGYCDSMHLSIR